MNKKIILGIFVVLAAIALWYLVCTHPDASKTRACGAMEGEGTVRTSMTEVAPEQIAAEAVAGLDGKTETQVFVAGTRIVRITTDEAKRISVTFGWVELTLKTFGVRVCDPTAILHNHPLNESLSIQDETSLREFRARGFMGRYLIWRYGKPREVKE
jgi:hypothetical protein